MEKYFSINKNKFSVRCKLYCDDIKNVQTAIIFIHGFCGHKDNGAAEKLAKHVLQKNKGVLVLCFNLPCHGDDARKKLVLDECGEYIKIVISYVKERWNPSKLYANATSFGGYLLLRFIAGEGNPFDKIALRCPAVTMYDVITNTIISEDELQKLKSGKSVSVGFDRKIEITSEFLNELRENDITKNDYKEVADRMLIVHGQADEVVPFSSSKEFAQKNNIAFVPVEGADHRFLDPFKMNFAIMRMIEFLSLK